MNTYIHSTDITLHHSTILHYIDISMHSVRLHYLMLQYAVLHDTTLHAHLCIHTYIICLLVSMFIHILLSGCSERFVRSRQFFCVGDLYKYCRASRTGDACRGRGRERERGISSELGKNRHCRRCRCCRRLHRRRRRRPRRRRRCCCCRYCCYSCCCLVLLSLSLLSL